MIFDVILISGKQGSGKTTVASQIITIVNGAKDHTWMGEEIIFAGMIYKMHDVCRQLLHTAGIQPLGVKDGNLLQLLGTEWGRKTLGENIWVDVVRNRIEVKKKIGELAGLDRLTIVVPDTRFKNELDVWPGAIKVRLECPEEVRKARCSMWRENTSHPSETGLDEHLDCFDAVFDSSVQPVEHIASEILFLANRRLASLSV